MLQICNLSFSYGSKKILKSVSLTQKKGEIVALLGPSGSGKTTLFQLITGLLPIQEGEIQIEGKSPLEARMEMTYLMQKDLLLPWRSALDNLLLLYEVQKKTPEVEKALSLLEEVGLADYAQHFPHELSGGMCQRVALARALLLNRPLLLLDEPFSSIDSMRKKELYLLLERLQKKYSLTILMITHDEHEARRLAQRIYYLEEGNLK